MKEAIIVLASQSPNRLKLLQQIGLKNVIVKVSNFEENLPKTLPVKEFVIETAKGKLATIVEEMKKNEEPYSVIIACDTVIEFNGEIIGKPADANDAVETLKRLRKNTHNVYTGMALHYQKTDQYEEFIEKTIVHFGDIPDRVIEEYVKSGEPLKKAGSYGIGEFGAVFVSGIEGCMPNVVGLPLHRLHQALIAKNIL
ncbi:Protein CBR-DOD-18 [Caenorhabditis briggsae]|uniref:Uncharacterized protein n=3 Tax=Caenorhabditis briggsae TaxID=6238 RepID=A0AAE9E1B0_CAEBR|nr:Protein CBR-DOD-18 [Caenorhabditis briggsae]ULU11092.1 hypothetical protein L3Y34_014946 [Caenorhabditis briggsae]UMM12054.1 hypothetical protein L5515_001026 [Caenorhabditis briggsae]CAP28082.2 Protein CBR-DOD-18 [Caenorhabditis briggsae]